MKKITLILSTLLFLNFGFGNSGHQIKPYSDELPPIVLGEELATSNWI